MDFDDLLMLVVKLLRTQPDVLASYRTRFKYVLVDEYQDTNRAQNEIVLLLGADHHNVTVVGDHDQAIYSFRKADIRNIMEFETAFPDAKVIALEQNYRSTKTILDAANAVIANNTTRVPKDLWTDGAQGDPIKRFRAEDEYDEAAWLAVGDRPDPPPLTGGNTATSPSSTGPTPRAGCSRRSSSATTSRTRWWGGPASMTGARSRTCSPTSGW